jgi:hypothetical protein
MVKPTIKGEIPRLEAMFAAPSIKRSAPHIKIAKPAMIAKISRALVMMSFSIGKKKPGIYPGFLL